MKPSRRSLRTFAEPAASLLLIVLAFFSQGGCGVRRAPTDHCLQATDTLQNVCCCENLSEPCHPSSSPLSSTNYLSDLFQGAFILYSRFLHPAVSRGCPSFPSCSRYMAEAVREFGSVAGLILGLERLLHETGELDAGRIIMTPEGPRVFDPIENNTFWWKSNEPQKTYP